MTCLLRKAQTRLSSSHSRRYSPNTQDNSGRTQHNPYNPQGTGGGSFTLRLHRGILRLLRSFLSTSNRTLYLSDLGELLRKLEFI